MRRTLLLFVVCAAIVPAAAGCNATEPPAFSADNAMTHVQKQLSFGPRVPGTAARDSVASYIAHTLEHNGARVTVQPFEVDDPYAPGRRLRLVNVIGSFGADNKRRLMLASHYDSRPWADQENDSTLWTTPIPGAVDGATSTAILLEIARLAGERAPGIGLDLVFFDGEDYGRESDINHYLLGSRHFAANLSGYRPVAAVLIDMVGGKGTSIRREGLSERESGALLDYVFARAAALELTYFDPAPGGTMYDDHVPLLQAGFAAIDLFGYDFGEWHTLGDDFDAVDPDRVRQTGVLLRDLVYNFQYGR